MKKLSNIILLFCLSLPLSAQPVFTQHTTGMTGTMRGLHAFSKDVVWISGTRGEFSMTRDGGTTWFHDTVQGCDSLDFRDVHSFSSDVALLMSAGPGRASAIFRTENGGKSWVLVYQNTDPKAFFDGMDFFDQNHGLIIGDPVDEKPYLLETKDGGRSWSRLNPSEIPDLIPGEYAFAASGTSLDACEDGSCYLVTGGSAARVFRSSDHGKTWKVADLPFLKGDPAAGAFSVAQGPEKKLAAVGGHYQKMTVTGSNMALSDDSGKTWKVPAGAVSVPFMECVRWIDSKTVIACGPPGIWLSTDAGTNWKEIRKPGFHAMDVAHGGKVIWVAGNKGEVGNITLELPTF